ncbi:MAG: 23S rRNA (adenine(2503)-C(2))-methyltransferase RlmN [Erysipelotrichales bacterium]|nr:23S rRNA (adenine(2503)-C(2))-methyltransferase RlmN [Erysipelotrichales bacterium]
MINLYGVELHKLEELMIGEEQKKFRATQLFTWIYEKKATGFDEMTDISLKFREVLKEKYCLIKPTIYTKQVSTDGTIKCLLNVKNDDKVETVIMRYNYGNVICISSQVGCNMACTFCASGLLKRKRNLDVEEMVGQVLVMNDLLSEENQRVTHVVVMGTGEPFDNYENVLDFVRIMNHPKAFAIGARHITVSTCGIPDKILRYANEGLQINLAISLHAPNDEIRSKIMPINRAYPLDKLMPAVREYERIAKRRVTFEYILLKDVNDRMEHAEELARLIKGTLAYVNLIPYNPVDEHGYKRSNNVHAFLDKLTKLGVTATIRKEFGTDIDAACGQLRAKHVEIHEN